MLPFRTIVRISRHPIRQPYTEMFAKAVSQQAPAPKSTQPFQTRPNPPILAKPSTTSGKRKFEKPLSISSSLGALHDATHFFNENDFDDDAAIDRTVNGGDVEYPSLENAAIDIIYPSLPTQAPGSHPAPPSSIPVPWSSSPPEHHQARPRKRRNVPWLDQQGNDTSLTPAHSNRTGASAYSWNQTASAIKTEQKQLRQANKSRSAGLKQEERSAANTNKDKALPHVFLSQEQKDIRAAVINGGKSIFFTGSAGTGKSVLMKSIIKGLRAKFHREQDRVAVTASTGLAAVNIDGTTLHSFAGIGLGKEPAPELVKKIRKTPKARSRWLRTKILIIDEISMIDGDLFDKLEHVARIIRNTGAPFGGIQLVVTGDFFQLPPVPEKDRVAKFSFDAATWNTCVEHTILLTHVFRQRDAVFAGMLNEMRLGRLTTASTRAFQSLARPLNFNDDLDATELFPTRAEVDNANNNKMKMLSGETFTYTAEDTGITDTIQRDRILSNCMAPKELQLKKGAQVMLIKNVDPQLVNGSLGKIVNFSDNETFAYRKDHQEEYNAAYLSTDDQNSQKTDSEIRRLREKISAAVYKNGNASRGRLLPVVNFQLPGGAVRQVILQPEDWKSELPNGEIQAARKQIPLILSWALSIHKAQGQTLERVKVDLGRVFEKGQAYVALSRATSQEGLQVTRFDARKVMVHPRVVQFYGGLVGFEELGGGAKDAGKAGATGYSDEENDDHDHDDHDEQFEHFIGGQRKEAVASKTFKQPPQSQSQQQKQRQKRQDQTL